MERRCRGETWQAVHRGFFQIVVFVLTGHQGQEQIELRKYYILRYFKYGIFYKTKKKYEQAKHGSDFVAS